MSEFVKGKAYKAIPTLQGAKSRLVVCLGRDAKQIQLAWADDLTVEHKEMFEGREIVQSKRPDGIFIVSSAAPLDVDAAAPIIDLLRRREAV